MVLVITVIYNLQNMWLQYKAITDIFVKALSDPLSILASATILKPLTVQVNNTDQLTTVHNFALKAWIKTLIWMLLDTNHAFKRPFRTRKIPIGLTLILPAGQHATPQKTAEGMWQKAQSANPASNFHSGAVPENKSMKGPLWIRFGSYLLRQRHKLIHFISQWFFNVVAGVQSHGCKINSFDKLATLVHSWLGESTNIQNLRVRCSTALHLWALLSENSIRSY